MADKVSIRPTTESVAERDSGERKVKSVKSVKEAETDASSNGNGNSTHNADEAVVVEESNIAMSSGSSMVMEAERGIFVSL